MAIQALLVILAVLLVLLFLGVPISYAIAVSSLTAILSSIDLNVAVLTAAQLDVSAERADDLANQREVLGLPIKRGGEVNKVEVRRALFAPFRGKVNGIAEDGHVVAPALAETHGIAIEHVNRGVKLHGKPSFGGMRNKHAEVV